MTTSELTFNGYSLLFIDQYATELKEFLSNMDRYTPVNLQPALIRTERPQFLITHLDNCFYPKSLRTAESYKFFSKEEIKALANRAYDFVREQHKQSMHA